MLLLTLGQGLHIKGHCWGPGFTREPSYTARCDSYHGHRRKGQNTHWQFGKYQIVISFMIQFLYKFILIGFFVRKIFLGSEAEYLSRFFLSLQNPWPAFILFYIFLFFSVTRILYHITEKKLFNISFWLEEYVRLLHNQHICNTEKIQQNGLSLQIIAMALKHKVVRVEESSSSN